MIQTSHTQVSCPVADPAIFHKLGPTDCSRHLQSCFSSSLYKHRYLSISFTFPNIELYLLLEKYTQNFNLIEIYSYLISLYSYDYNIQARELISWIRILIRLRNACRVTFCKKSVQIFVLMLSRRCDFCDFKIGILSVFLC